MNTQKSSNKILVSINTLMMWLFCLTVIMLIVPWELVSSDFATRIENHKMFLYLALIIEVSNLITQGLISIFSAVNQKKHKKLFQEKVEHNVETLDFAERALLREYVLQRKSVLRLPVTEPTVKALIEGGVLKIVGVVDKFNNKADVIISKEARPYITYKAIGLTLGKMSDEQISQIMSARPFYAKPKFQNQNRVVVGAMSVKKALTDNNGKETLIPQPAENTNIAA